MRGGGDYQKSMHRMLALRIRGMPLGARPILSGNKVKMKNENHNEHAGAIITVVLAALPFIVLAIMNAICC